MKTLLSSSNHSAQQSQSERLQERKSASTSTAKVCGVDFVIHPGVYGTSVDTELMAETVVLNSNERFLEIGCGSGAISLLLAGKCAEGLAVDINPLAVVNAQENAKRLGVTNVIFRLGDGFAGIQQKFDVLICNPPYNNYPVKDSIERMFWDPDDELKKMFFRQAVEHLLPGGRIYFGWANFQDIDINLPLKLAADNGLILKNITERPSHNGKYSFYVLEFAASN
jgi:methylase of polypeptide subunit release factors